jgi:hypothetical protein
MPGARSDEPDAQFQALVRARFAGDPAAITALGARVVVGRDAPQSPVDGAALITEAARQGDPAARAYISVLAAAGDGRAQSWTDAYAALERAATLGDPSASAQIALLGELHIADAAAAQRWVDGAERAVLRETPRFHTCSAFLPVALCNYLIARARPKLVEAKVFDAKSGGLKVDAMRSNTGAVFSVIETDFVIQLVRARIADAASVAADALEPPEVLH